MNESRAVAELLRRNDPNVEGVCINLREQDDAALAQALERNDYVNSIQFLFNRLPQTEPQQQQQHWDNLLRVLAAREKLEKVQFDGDSRDLQPIPLDHAMILQVVQQNAFLRSMRFSSWNLASGDIVSSFLDTATFLLEFELDHCVMTSHGAERIAASLQRHTSLRTLSLDSLEDSSGELVSSFLDTATSLTKFDLTSCEMTTQGAGRIAASLQRHTNLQTLSLYDLEESNLLLIVQGLQTNTCLQSLTLIYGTLGQAVPPAIQHLLEHTSSIRFLKFDMLSFMEENFHPICQGLIHSTAVSRVQFSHCQFCTQASADLFRQMIDTKPNLQLLSIHQCSFPGNLIALVGATISAALLRPNSLLRTFELIQDDLNSFFPGPAFGALLSAVGRSSLERFSIGDLHTDLQFQTLLSNLPAMKIVMLEFHLRGLVGDGRDRNRAILQAAKRNFSLRSLKASFFGVSVFTDDDENLLQSYFDRNERLAQWVANPASVPRRLWPEALGLALESGEDTLYRSLQAVLGDEVESTLGQRKRKRQAGKDKMKL